YWSTVGTGVVRFKDGGYQVSALSVTVLSNPSPPTSVGNGSRCGAGNVTLSATPGANANSIRWYTSSSGGFSIHTGTSFTVNLSNSTTYYASSFNSSAGRESSTRVPVYGVINANPNLPSVTPGNSCGSGQVLLLASPGANGNQVKWYSDDVNMGWIQVGTGPSYTTPNISETKIYHASTLNTSTGCESATTAVNANVNPIPGLPTAVNSERCGSGVVVLGAGSGNNGNTVRWYSQSSSGTVLAEGLNYNTPTLQGTTTYHISTFNSSTTCESNRVAVVATVNTIPQNPNVNSNSRCGSGLISLSASPGAGGDNVKWFSTSSGATLITTGTLYQPTLSSTTTYYVSSLNSTGYCESSRVPITATIHTIPTAALSLASQTICSAQAMATVNFSNPNGVNGTTYSWTVSAPNISGTSAGSGASISQTLSQTTSVNQTAIYTITPTANGCQGNSITHTVTVKPIPTVAVSSPSQLTCSGQSMSAINLSNPNGVSGTTYSWTVLASNITGASSGNGALIAQALSQTTSTNQTATYTITPTANSCSGTSTTHIVIVKPLPTVAVSSPSQLICSGQEMAIVDITNPNGVSGTAYNWTVSAPNIA
ncbi:MAG: hypothetical protein O9262_13815, partial [Cyclobacteriaceae bacterium]|nr:hypothetical protein [Cyclobacteriaceae bacterium]